MKSFLPILILLAALLGRGNLFADGGYVCFQQDKGPYRITVFADPAPLRAGPVDFSVLVRERESGKALTDAKVKMVLSPNFDIENGKDGEWLPPCCRLEANTFTGEAPIGAGGNGLLYESRLSLNQPGSWHMDVEVERGGEKIGVSGEVAVEGAAPPWRVFWPYLLLPLLGLGFLAMNWTARRSATVRSSSSATPACPEKALNIGD